MSDLTIKTEGYYAPEDTYEVIGENVVSEHRWTTDYEQIVKNKETGEVFGYYYTTDNTEMGEDVDSYILREEDGWEVRALYPTKQKMIYTIDKPKEPLKPYIFTPTIPITPLSDLKESLGDD